MKVILTGYKGYIGTILTQKLIEKNYDVLGIDLNLYSDFDLEKITPSIKEINKDIRKIEKKDLIGYDAIIHLAALSNDPLGELNPGLTEDINFKASVKLAELGKKAGIKRFIFSSSCSVYGKAEEDQILSETDPTSPITEYAKSKIYTEDAIKKLADNEFTPVFMRNATVYGYSPSLRLDLVVNSLTAYAYFTKKINITGDGRPWRPLIHVADLSDVFIKMLEASKDNVHNEVFNVGFSEENYQVKGIAEMIQKNIPDTEITVGMKFDPDSRSYNVNFDKLKKIIKPSRNWNVQKGSKQLYEKLIHSKLTKEDFNQKACQRLQQLKQVKDKYPNFFEKSLI